MAAEDDKAELKAMVAAAKKNPVNIGICMGKKAAECVVVMDRRRAPDALVREAKKAGKTAKLAGGTLFIDGRKGALKCESAPPSGLGKQLREYFKSVGFAVDFEVFAPDGKMVAEDDGEAGGVEGGGPAAPGEAAPPSETVPPSETAAPAKVAETPPGPAADPRAVAEKLKGLKTAIAAIGGKPGETLNAAFAKIVEQMKSGAVAEAALAVEKLAALVAKAGTAPGESAPGAPAATPETVKFGPVVTKVQKLVDALPAGDARDAMTAILAKVSEALAQGDTSTLAAQVKKVQDGLALQAAIDGMAPRVAEAASKGLVPDVNAMMLLFNQIADRVPAPDHAKAMAALDRIEALIAAGGGDAGRKIGADVKPFAASRIEWGGSRNTMMAEVNRLQAAIRARCETVGGLQEVIDSLEDLVAPLAAIDSQLEDKLDQIVNAPAGSERDGFKSEARALIGRYRAELAKPYFAEIDNSNGFVKVSVTATALAALQKVEAVLAA